MRQAIGTERRVPIVADLAVIIGFVFGLGCGVMLALLAMQDNPRAMPPTMEMGEP